MRKSNLNTGSSYILRMLPGVTVSGRIVQNGKGLNGIEMVLESVTREEALFGKTKPRSVVKTITDGDGAFHSAELSPNEEHLLFGNGPSFRNVGYLPDVKLPSRADKTIVNLGDLEVLPGFSISGKLFMKDSSPLPEKVSLRVSTKRDVNGRFIEVSPDGTFHVKGLPPGPCQIRIARANHRIVPNQNNASIQDYQEVNLDGDVKDFELLIETVPEIERVPQ